MARTFHLNSSPVLAAVKILSDLSKRPCGGVFLCSSRFWAGFALVLIFASFLSADHYRPWVNFHAEAIAVAGAVLGGAALIAQRGGFYFSRFWFLWVGCAGAAALIQWWLLPGIFFGDVVIAVIFLGALLCSISLGLNVGQSQGTFVSLAFSLLGLVSCLSGLIGILQWLSLSDILGVFGAHTDIGDRAMGNIAQPNQLGTLLLMGLCAHTYLFDRRQFSGFTFSLLVLVTTFALALTQSRTALLSATALALFAFSPGASRLRIKGGWIALWLLIFWALFLAIPAVNDWLLLGGGRNIQLMSSNSRDIVWKQTGYAIMQQPWLGYGWNRTATAHMAAAAVLPGELTFTYAHNVVLDLLAWYGVPLGIGLTGSLAYWLWSRWKKLNTPMGVCAFAAIIPFAIHSLLEFPFAYGYFLVTAGLLVGIVEVSVGAQGLRMRRFFVVPMLALLGALSSVTVYEYLSVEEDFRVARFSNMRIGRTPEGFVYSDIRVLTHMRDMLKASRMHPHADMTIEEIELLKQVAKRFPYGALTYRYVEALALNSKVEDAKRELKILLGLYGPKYYSAIRIEIAERGRTYPALLELLED